jgi:hypothetical protein
MKKKLLTFCGIALAGIASAQSCSELFFSMYICASGENKAVEIYNPTANAIVLTGNYQLKAYYNGATSATTSGTRPLIGTIGAHSTWVFSNGQTTIDSVFPAPPSTPYGTPPCDTALMRVANQLDSAHYPGFTYFNGDDALTLEKNISGNWTTIDIFGCVGERPTTGTGTHVGWWNTPPYDAATTGHAWTKYHTLIRKPSVTAGTSSNPAPLSWNVSVQWDSLPNSSIGVKPNYYPQPNANSTLNYTHFCDCNANGIQEYMDNVHVNVFPNPSNAGLVNVTAGVPIEMLQVYNLVGEVIYQEKITNPGVWVSFETKGIPAGAYLLKTSFGGNQAHVTKIVVQ